MVKLQKISKFWGGGYTGGEGGFKVKHGEYLFTHHQLIQKLGTIPCNKLCCKLDDVSEERKGREERGGRR